MPIHPLGAEHLFAASVLPVDRFRMMLLLSPHAPTGITGLKKNNQTSWQEQAPLRHIPTANSPHWLYVGHQTRQASLMGHQVGGWGPTCLQAQQTLTWYHKLNMSQKCNGNDLSQKLCMHGAGTLRMYVGSHGDFRVSGVVNVCRAWQTQTQAPSSAMA